MSRNFKEHPAAIDSSLVFDAKGHWISTVGFVCPRCKAVARQSGFAHTCTDPSCRFFGYAFRPQIVVHRFRDYPILGEKNGERIL